jgi:hypothetical protein
VVNGAGQGGDPGRSAGSPCSALDRLLVAVITVDGGAAVVNDPEQLVQSSGGDQQPSTDADGGDLTTGGGAVGRATAGAEQAAGSFHGQRLGSPTVVALLLMVYSFGSVSVIVGSGLTSGSQTAPVSAKATA